MTRRATAVAAMLLLGFGVLGMHVMLAAPSMSPDQSVGQECHHDQDGSVAKIGGSQR